ncbi:MAG: hypothetical protein J7494_14460 [Sphingobium sp.]|nr:hypothetical protein [Sphingobium sp.]
MQIRQILKPCAACGESLIFGHFAPQGDVLKFNEGWSRVCCPTCQHLGPVRSSFREACESWDALAHCQIEQATTTSMGDDQVPNNPWPLHSMPAEPVATSAPR